MAYIWPNGRKNGTRLKRLALGLITLNNVIVIVEGIEEKNSIGFTEKRIAQDDFYDETICNEESQALTLNQQYVTALSRMNYEVSFDFDIDYTNKKKVNNFLYEFTKKNKNGTYEIHKEDIFDLNPL